MHNSLPWGESASFFLPENLYWYQPGLWLQHVCFPVILGALVRSSQCCQWASKAMARRAGSRWAGCWSVCLGTWPNTLQLGKSIELGWSGLVTTVSSYAISQMVLSTKPNWPVSASLPFPEGQAQSFSWKVSMCSCFDWSNLRWKNSFPASVGDQLLASMDVLSSSLMSIGPAAFKVW